MKKLYSYKGVPLQLTDKTLSMDEVSADAKVVGDRLKDVPVASARNCKIIAHPGYHVNSIENTIASLIEAHDNGFGWIEIDIRPTADNVYVLSHNAQVTLYNNGTAVYVNLSESNYNTVKGYTWDQAGEYQLATLQAAFSMVRLYEMNIICDRKGGINSDIVQLAAQSSALDKIMLSYPTFAAAYAERALLNKYPYIPIRVWPGDPENVEQLRGAITNPIYADTNVQGLNNYTLATPLSFGIPFVFSGCELATADIWAPLANGCMAATGNISLSEFLDVLDIDFNVPVEITPSSVSTISVAVDGTETITATSDGTTMVGNIYGYTEDMSIARVIQRTFGTNVSIDIKGISAGQTTLVLFTGTGSRISIPVTVS